MSQDGGANEQRGAAATATAEAICRQRLHDGGPRAAADLGLLLFRSQRQEEAIPYLERAVSEGDARAQYLLGVAFFNGDHVAPDPVRARALLEAAAAAGIVQARVALADLSRSADGADPGMLLSARAVAAVSAQVARLRRPEPPTLDAMTRDLLVPLLRERLETQLPAAVQAGVERTLATVAGQPSPVRS